MSRLYFIVKDSNLVTNEDKICKILWCALNDIYQYYVLNNLISLLMAFAYDRWICLLLFQFTSLDFIEKIKISHSLRYANIF